jgi:hypothetical protein
MMVWYTVEKFAEFSRNRPPEWQILNLLRYLSHAVPGCHAGPLRDRAPAFNQEYDDVCTNFNM